MPKIFLSYCRSQRAWLEAFRRTELLESELNAQQIFDYEVRPTTQGSYHKVIEEFLQKSEVFIAVIDKEYPKRRETLHEFHVAYQQFFRNGSSMPGKAFGLIFIDQDGLSWFEQNRYSGRERFPEDIAYRKMFDYHGPRYPYTESDRPNGAVIEALRNFLTDVGFALVADPSAGIDKEKPVPIVVLGHIADPAPPVIASARDTLKRLVETRKDLPVERLVLADGWPNVCAPGLLDFAARGAIFVLPVDETMAQLVATRPTMLLEQLQSCVGLSGTTVGSSHFDRSVLVYWMPSGVESVRFRQKLQNTGEAPGPCFRTGSAEEMAAWLAYQISPEHPPPPIHYESAPLDDAMQQLSNRLKEALDGIFRPPEPNVLAFIPDERPLNDELGKMAKARGGIFITHAIGTEAASLEVPSDLKDKVLRYAEKLGEFCAANRLRPEKIYRVALVRQRNEFWRGRWSADLGRGDARLRGWRFLGIRKNQTGGFEMDQVRIAQCVAEIRTLFEPV